SVIADGLWHLYEWNLADPAQWDIFNNGDGDIDGPVTTVDSIFISSLTDQNATVWLDALSYNPTGSVAAVVPDPASAGAAAALLALAALSRRRKEI
ncbi:MAG: hypothetical protein QOE14_562, partial [Humisphaera sp.]|nr:hypothetical protein [Humisphaera sp.]